MLHPEAAYVRQVQVNYDSVSVRTQATPHTITCATPMSHAWSGETTAAACYQSQTVISQKHNNVQSSIATQLQFLCG
jgi:hypothetical protein